MSDESNKYYDNELLEFENYLEKGVINLPFPSAKYYMKDKKSNYETYGILALYSNMKPINLQCEEGIFEQTRFTYQNNILLHTEEIENFSGKKITTIMRNIKKLAKSKSDLVMAVRTNKGEIVYILQYAQNGKKFVTIEDIILKKLLDAHNGNVIKVYIFLKYMCRNGGKIISRKFIAENIGLSYKSCKNLNIITNITDALERLGLIKKNYIGEENRTQIYYEIVDFKTWVEFEHKRLKSKHSKK